MARIITGFSKPYVAKYGLESGKIKYTDRMVLAHGVNVSIDAETSDSNIFYADNKAVDSVPGTFTGGKFTLEVDGLSIDAEKMVMGLPTAGEDGWTAYDNTQNIPYIGLGFIVRYRNNGVTKYQPYVIARCTFEQVPLEAATQEESIEWQKETLTGVILRAEDEAETWRWSGAEFATEAEAEAALVAKLA